MRGDASAYAVLGLGPDADRQAIDRAYRKLIKLHHPDRDGGDASRAAEINHAYRTLRGRFALSDPLILHDEDEGTGNGWVRIAMVLIAALAALFFATGPVTAWMRQLSQKPVQAAPAKAVAPASTSDSMDQPIDRRAVQQAVTDAMRIGSGNDNALLTASNVCQRNLRAHPGVAQLDRCAAFDDAVVQLQNRDPSWDGGPFSQLAISRRQWSAASALSNDYLAVDGRLDRIRVEVELALAAANADAPPVSADPSGLRHRR
jgi:hypothetical protein